MSAGRPKHKNSTVLEQGFRKYMNIEYKHKALTKEEKTYKDDVISTLQYLKLKKIKHLMEQNLGDLEANNSTRNSGVITAAFAY